MNRDTDVSPPPSVAGGLRVRGLLRSTAPRESRRLDLALARGAVIVAGPVMLLIATMFDPVTAPVGPTFFRALTGFSAFLVFFLAVRLSGDSVGDFQSGLLEQLFITGVEPHHWIAVRLVQMWIGFASVWLVRLPLLAFIYTLGVGLQAIVAVELLMMTGFLVLSSVGLLAAFQAKSRQQVQARVLMAMFAWEIVLWAPMILDPFLLYFPGSTTDRIMGIAKQIAELGFVSRWRVTGMRPVGLWECLPTVALYAALATLALGYFRRSLLAVSSGSIEASRPDSVARVQRGKRKERESRRCWSDALAWQAYCVHGGGTLLVKAKCVGYVLLGIGLLVAIPFKQLEVVFVLSAATCAISMLVAMNKPSDCLTREIRERTITMLLLTPHSLRDFLTGWQRGAFCLGWPDIVMGLAMTLASFAIDPIIPATMLTVGAAILLSSSFLLLSSLVPFTFSGFATGFGVVFALMFITLGCIGCAAAVHPFGPFFVLIPVALLFNRYLQYRLIPRWMLEKISSAV